MQFKIVVLAVSLTLLGACGGPCSDGAASCNEDGNAEVCLDGNGSIQETCQAEQTCAIEAGVAFCIDDNPSAAPGPDAS